MSGDIRRSTAAQFFMDEETAANEGTSTYDRVVELLNQASLTTRDTQKISNLRQVQELIIHKDPTLLDNFLDEMLAFQSDRSVDVKRFVIGFMEEASKKDPEVLSKVLPSLNMLLSDDNVNVQKKVILTLIPMYRSTIQWLSKAKSPTPEMTASWEQMHNLKSRLFDMLDSENDGIRTHVVKFLESLVLVLSKRSADSDVSKKQEAEVSLDQIPDGRHYLKLKKMEEQGRKTFETLVQFQASPHISSINLMTVMGALTNIAKQRPIFFDQVVQSFEALHVNLPPTLSKSQVSSVRKNLKMQMMALLKHPASVDHVTQIATLLTDLGASQSEINKNMPKSDDGRKRKLEEPSTSSKKAKVEEVDIDIDDDDIGMTPWSSRMETRPTGVQKQTAIDITAEDLEPKLTAQHVADLVLLSMVMLPDTMPAQFQSTYTPIAAAGTDAQVKHLARLLATQLTMAGMGKGLGELQRSAMENPPEDDGSTSPVTEQGTSPKHIIQTLVGGTVNKMEFKKPEVPVAAVTVPARKGVIRQFKLATVTHPLDPEKLDNMTVSTVKRIFSSEKIASVANIPNARMKILSCLTAHFGGELKDLMQEYIFEDLRTRSELAFSWLYQEYANCQGFSVVTPVGERPNLASYDECLTRLLRGLMDKADQKDGLFSRLILEAPVITDNAVSIIRKYCQDEERISIGMATLKELILMRPSHRLRFLDVLLDFTSHEKSEVRNTAIRETKKLYENLKLQAAIEKYAVVHLKKLLLPKPPAEVHSMKALRSELPESWTEETIKIHLYVYLGLLPTNHRLIHELANVYTATSADIKRTILRVLENPVKGMGMQSPELLRLVENCPKGAETLVMRVIHILTDKTVPSPELVERIRDLYHKRVPDVRFLIPVLTGLSKKEVTAALPKLIKLNPMVVKEVFNRLMGGHGDSSAGYTSPLTPAELLVSLHNIDPTKCDMKTIIKAANLCFSEKYIYTQEVLAIVMQQLMEQNPLPTLLMRTVLQSLSMYPRLIGFVMNILQRLITKQVWKQKKVWEGFVKCCQRTKPQSFQVLLQLPAVQLKNVFEICPDLREPLLSHVMSFTDHQQAHIPKSIITVLEKDPLEEQRQAETGRVEKEKLAEVTHFQQEKFTQAAQMEKERNAEVARQEKERQERIKLEERLDSQKKEQFRLANERLEREKTERERKEKERLEHERQEKQKREQQEKERQEREKQKKEQQEKERQESEKRAKAEKEEKEREEREKQVAAREAEMKAADASLDWTKKTADVKAVKVEVVPTASEDINISPGKPLKKTKFSRSKELSIEKKEELLSTEIKTEEPMDTSTVRLTDISQADEMSSPTKMSGDDATADEELTDKEGETTPESEGKSTRRSGRASVTRVATRRSTRTKKL